MLIESLRSHSKADAFRPLVMLAIPYPPPIPPSVFRSICPILPRAIHSDVADHLSLTLDDEAKTGERVRRSMVPKKGK